MQASPKRHLPIVGLLGLLVVAGAGGTLAYYQYVVPHQPSCAAPVHRLIFMNAVIQELGGFTINSAAIVNGTALPKYDSTTSRWNFTGVQYQNYTADPKTISANVGDTLTLYIVAKNVSDTRQYKGIPGHGFTFNPVPSNSNVTLPATLAFNKLFTATFVVNQPMSYACTIACSDKHSEMNGSISVCGA